jgi:hypothetical protein
MAKNQDRFKDLVMANDIVNLNGSLERSIIGCRWYFNYKQSNVGRFWMLWLGSLNLAKLSHKDLIPANSTVDIVNPTIRIDLLVSVETLVLDRSVVKHGLKDLYEQSTSDF